MFKKTLFIHFLIVILKITYGIKFFRAIPSNLMESYELFFEINTKLNISRVHCAALALSTVRENPAYAAFKYDGDSKLCSYGNFPRDPSINIKLDIYKGALYDPDAIYINELYPIEYTQMLIVYVGKEDQVIDLKRQKTCSFKPKNYEFNEPFIMKLLDEYVACGGGVNRQCKIYDPLKNDWKIALYTLPNDRREATVYKLGVDKFWISGGYTNDGSVTFSSLLFDKNTFSTIPNNGPFSGCCGPCIIHINSSFAIGAGTYSERDQIFLLNLKDQTYRTLNSFSGGYGPACGWYRTSSGERKYVFSGGRSPKEGANGPTTKTIIIDSLSPYQEHQGSNFESLFMIPSVQFDGYFMTFGGLDEEGRNTWGVGTIYKFDYRERYIPISQTITPPQFSTDILPYPEDTFPCD